MNKKWLALLLTGVLMCSSAGTIHVHASQEEIAAIESQRANAQANLSATQSQISSLEAARQEMQNYLSELNGQYEALTAEISNLSVQAGQKEEDLKKVQENLASAKVASDEQYENMKLRMVYLFENGSTNAFSMLLSSENVADFLNRAENIRQISNYDRNMLEKYQKLQEEIRNQEAAVEKEIEEINALLQERAQKQAEVETLVAQTNDNISAYASQISASQAEANALIAEINAADVNISILYAQQAAAQAAAQAEAEAAYNESYDDGDSYSEDSYDDSNSEDSYSEDSYTEDSYSEDSYDDSYTEDSYSEDSYTEDSYTEDSYTEESYEDTSSQSSSSGTYLGNFTLTAYCNCASCCGTAGNLTASGTVPTSGRTVAMAGVPFGTQLLINGNVYTVEDLGTPYGHVDIFMDSHSSALSFGLQSAEVYRLN